MVNLNTGILASLQIPFPKYEEQIQIEKHLYELEMDHVKLLERRDKLSATKNGLMQDLLTGKVRVTELLKDVATASP